jgi:L-Ala-D/L-Glu epimerase
VKITKIDVHPVAIPYPIPFKTASRAKPAQGDVIIKIHTDEGIVGLGDAVSYTGSSLTMLTAALVNELCPVIIGHDPLQIETLIVQRLGGMDCPWLRALTASDLALWDIAGKYYKKPVYELLGGAARTVFPLSHSMSIKSPRDMAEDAAALKDRGYRLLTVKIGIDPDEDLQRVKAVKQAVGDSVAVEVDGNEGYTLDIAIKYIRQMEDMISGCEQPLPRWDVLGMAELTRVLDTPVIADQSLNSARDIALFARLKAADVMCLKLGPFGGITLTQKALTVAQAHGLPCSIGAGHPLGIATSAMHQFVAANPWIRLPIGYGSPVVLLHDDVIKDPIQVKDGTVEVLHGHGLGVEIDDAKLKKYAHKVTIEHEKPVTVAIDRPRPWQSGI